MHFKPDWIRAALLTMLVCVPPCPLRAEEVRGMTADEIFAQVELRGQKREAALNEYSNLRMYRVLRGDLTVRSEMKVKMKYSRPANKNFEIVSKAGSGWVHRFVFQRLIDAETDAAGKEKHDSSITMHNYSFELLGEETVRGYPCYVFSATPNKKAKYLFVGKVWVAKDDYGIVKVDGQPAARLSFWVRHTNVVRDYERVGQFWLPLRDYSENDILIFGKNIVEIDYSDYSVKSELESAKAQTAPSTPLR